MKTLSTITLGTMRLVEKGFSSTDFNKLLQIAKYNGVTSLHVSPEYQSYPLISSVYQSRNKLENSKNQFIVKLAAPHFSEIMFDPRGFEQKIDDVLRSLNCEKLEVVQWMWRMNPLNDDARIQRTNQQLEQINETFEKLVRSGKVLSFSCFPYTKRYMRFMYQSKIVSSQTNYLNFWETNAIDCGLCSDTLILRPLASGEFKHADPSLLDKLNNITKLRESELLAHCIRFPLSSSRVRSLIISMHSESQIKQIMKIADSTKRSEDMFNKYKSFLPEISSRFSPQKY